MTTESIKNTADLLAILLEGGYKVKGLDEISTLFLFCPVFTFRGVEVGVDERQIREAAEGHLSDPLELYAMYKGHLYQLMY